VEMARPAAAISNRESDCTKRNTTMQQLKELLVEQLQDLLHAEMQLTRALPKMAEASHHPKLKEAFEKHLVQTESHVERLRDAFGLLGEQPEPKPCKAMMGLVDEGKETIDEGSQKETLAADLALIAAAQRVEHYEISAYGTAKCLARQIGELDCARLLSYTLGEEESADFLLSAIAEPLMQQASLDDAGATVNLESVADNGNKKSGANGKKTTATAKAGKSAQEAVSRR
jgi:Mn-containing catalase